MRGFRNSMGCVGWMPHFSKDGGVALGGGGVFFGLEGPAPPSCGLRAAGFVLLVPGLPKARALRAKDWRLYVNAKIEADL